MTAGPTDARAAIGRTRGRLYMHWPWYTWSLVVALPLLVCGGILLSGSVRAAVICLILLLLLSSLPITIGLRAWRTHITDHAIVVGPFLPGTRRSVFFYTDLDVSTIRAWRNTAAYLRSSGAPRFLMTGQVNPGSQHGISWGAWREHEIQRGVITEVPSGMEQKRYAEIVSTVGGSRRAIRILARALDDARIAPAEAITRQALPPGRLSPELDAHLRQIPGWPEPVQTRFENLPPELQERYRHHIVED